MVSLQCASENEFASLKVSKMPCCKSGICTGPGIEETMQQKMEKCSGGVATGSRQMKGSE